MNRTLNISQDESESKKRSLLADLFIRLIKEKPVGVVSGIIVLILLICGIFANFLAPYGMNEIHLDDRLAPPSTQFLLGTDHLGRDTFSRIIYGARISVIVGLAATSINVMIATLIGTVTGFFRGRTDTIAQRFVDAWMAFPGLLILITVMSFVGTGMIQIITVLGITGGIRSSRVVRSAVIGIMGNTYIEAAESIGSPTSMTLIRHVLPNIMAPLIIVFSTSIGGVILSEASLSFLGFGLPPDIPSWGGMLSGEGRRFMEIAPRLALWPGFALSIVVYGVNMFGDSVRDLLDPKLRGGVGGMGARGMALARKALEKKIGQVNTNQVS